MAKVDLVCKACNSAVESTQQGAFTELTCHDCGESVFHSGGGTFLMLARKNGTRFLGRTAHPGTEIKEVTLEDPDFPFRLP